MDKTLEKTELEKRLEAELAAAQEAEADQPSEEAAALAGQVPPEPPEPPIDVAALTAERDDLQDKLLRARAEFDNYRKRMAREAERTRKLAAESLISSLLPVVDNLERAANHAGGDSGQIAEGLGMVLKQFSEVLAKHGLHPIPAQGAAFDPNVHEAVMRVETGELPPDHVVQEFVRGYRLGDYVLRPSKVSVSGAPAANANCEMQNAETENGGDASSDAGFTATEKDKDE